MAKNNLHQKHRKAVIAQNAEQKKADDKSAEIEEVRHQLDAVQKELEVAQDVFNSSSPEEKDRLSSSTQALLDSRDALQLKLEALEDEANGELGESESQEG